MKYKLWLIALAISGTAFSDMTFAEDLVISSPQGDEYKVYAGLPIVAKQNGKLIRHYKKGGEVNNYYWANADGDYLEDGIVYIPDSNMAGEYVKLCLFDEDNNSRNCSNEVRVAEYSELNPKMITRSANVVVSEAWTITDSLTDEFIYENAEVITVSTEFERAHGTEAPISTYRSWLQTKAEGGKDVVLMQAIPFNADRLVDGEDYAPINSSRFLSHSFDELSDLLAQHSAIEVCGEAYLESGDGMMVITSNCDSRIIFKENLPISTGDGTYILPPTTKQFEALFPDVKGYRNHALTYQDSNGYTREVSYVLSVRNQVNKDDLHKRYCDSVSIDTVARPMSAKEFHTLQENTEAFGAAWPKDITNYWVNDLVAEEEKLFPIPGGWSKSVSPINNNQSYLTSSSYFMGFFSCYIPEKSE